MTESPKPSFTYLAVSVLVILFSLVLVSTSISAIADTGNPFSLIGGPIIFAISMSLVIQQYRATFRQVRSAATFAAVMLFIGGGFLAFALVVTFGEMVSRGVHLAWLGILLPVLAMSLFGAVAGWLNMRWSRKLPKLANSSPGFRFTIRELLAVTAMVSFVMALTTLFIRSDPPKYAEHVDISAAPFGLPENATDISFCRGNRGTIAYEFRTDETSFRDWVASGIGSMESITSGEMLVPIANPVFVRRYNVLSADLTGPDSITVDTGLHYVWSYEDRGVDAVFDSSTNRAYYYAHFH